MKGRWILAAVFLLPAIAAGYMTWLSWQADEGGKWLFGVFTVFFLMLGAAPLLPKPPQKKAAAGSTRFVPHWFMLLAGLVLLFTLILGVVAALRH